VTAFALPAGPDCTLAAPTGPAAAGRIDTRFPLRDGGSRDSAALHPSDVGDVTAPGASAAAENVCVSRVTAPPEPLTDERGCEARTVLLAAARCGVFPLGFMSRSLCAAAASVLTVATGDPVLAEAFDPKAAVDDPSNLTVLDGCRFEFCAKHGTVSVLATAVSFARSDRATASRSDLRRGPTSRSCSDSESENVGLPCGSTALDAAAPTGGREVGPSAVVGKDIIGSSGFLSDDAPIQPMAYPIFTARPVVGS
jgi:hypothetical protein